MYYISGKSDIGCGRDVNEDYVSITEFDSDTILAIVADGAGSQPSGLQPAVIAASEIILHIRRQFNRGVDYLCKNAEEHLEDAFMIANRVVGAFKTANEEYYSGVGCSLTACLMMKDGKFAFCHIGNTRLYMFRRNPKTNEVLMRQITTDDTLAKSLYDDGVLKDSEEYYLSESRLTITNALGVLGEPFVAVSKGTLRENEILLLTTDGIHYAVREPVIKDIVLGSANSEDAVSNLITAAKYTNYNDNYAALIINRV